MTAILTPYYPRTEEAILIEEPILISLKTKSTHIKILEKICNYPILLQVSNVHLGDVDCPPFRPVRDRPNFNRRSDGDLCHVEPYSSVTAGSK